MKQKAKWIAQTGILLALLVTLQFVTGSFGQLVTGSCVNAVLAVAVLLGGLASGLTVALCSPVLAFLLHIAPQVLTVPAIMVGNSVYVLLLWLLADRSGKNLPRQLGAWLLAAAAKAGVLYLLVVKLICGVLAEELLAAGTLNEKLMKMLPTMFSWTQLFTALIGGAAALLMVPVLRKALRR